MKILSIHILRREPSSLILASEIDLSSFSYFQRSSGKEFMDFFAMTLSQRTAAGIRQSVEQEGNVGHVYTNSLSLSCVIIADKEYPSRVAFTLIGKILDEFSALHSKQVVASTIAPLAFPVLKEYFVKYQNPHEADNILKVQKELDETKVILHNTIESVLARGEKLDNLVAQSEQLSTQSKSFYKVAKKTNSGCCSIQ